MYDSFGIRCPLSVLGSTDTIYSSDFESDTWDINPFNDTAFCGKLSLKNSISLFYGISASLDYKYVNISTYLCISLIFKKFIIDMFCI